MKKEEAELKNFLKENNIYKSDSGMQVIILNSFYNEAGMDNDDSWKRKVNFIHSNFGSFKKYALQYWGDSTNQTKVLYLLFDQNYINDPNQSGLLEVTTTLEEAKIKFPAYGSNTYPVKCILEKNEDDQYVTTSSSIMVL